jgi:hypothetical protein
MLCAVRRIHAEFAELLLEKDLGHHALVLMAQQMAVEERYAPDDRIGEFHHQVNIPFNGDIDRIQPFRPFEPDSALGVDEEVNLMDVKRVHLVGVIRDSPMMKSPNGYGWPAYMA